MQTLNLDLTKRYSYADYLGWFDDIRRELHDGFIKLMSPAPNFYHQDISGNLSFELMKFLKNKKCKVIAAPFDVRFPKKNSKGNKTIFTVVQPDISVICDLSKLDKRGCLGAPDMIVEIVSPSNVERDIEEKFKIYEENGVREYWIAFPETKMLHVFLLDKDEKYKLVGMYSKNKKVKVNIFEDLFIDLSEIFTYELED